MDFSNTIIDCINDSIYIDTEGVLDYAIRIVSEDGLLLEEHTSMNAMYSLAAFDEPCYLVLDKHNYKPYILYYNPAASYIQNRIIKHDSYYRGNDIVVGNNVTSSISHGDVIIEENSKMVIDSDTKVFIKNGFTCQKGGRLLIK